MMLTLLGLPTSKWLANHLFQSIDHYATLKGITSYALARAVAKVTGVSDLLWIQIGRPSFFELTEILLQQDISLNKPFVIVMRAIHKSKHLRCWHATLCTGCNKRAIHLLDPLGPRKLHPGLFNVKLTSIPLNNRYFAVEPSCYVVDRNAGVDILGHLPFARTDP